MGLNKGCILSTANFTSNRPRPAKLSRECVLKHTHQQTLEENENLKNPNPMSLVQDHKIEAGNLYNTNQEYRALCKLLCVSLESVSCG
jgi:protein tyrosine/serine phosphatase